MLSPKEIINKVGPDRIRKAMEAGNGDALKELLESEKIFLTDEQLDYIAGGVEFDGGGDLLGNGHRGSGIARTCTTE